MNKNVKRQKGFTLIELLVVIAIVAVLSLVVIFTLSPAELLRQARDSNRISDMSLLKTAISFYLVDVTSPNINGGTNLKCFGTYGPTSTAACDLGPLSNNIAAFASSVSRAVDGSGWLPIKFSDITSGAPFGTLPLDPVNTVNYYYVYTATSPPGITFKLGARVESIKYSASGTSDIATTDQGSSDLWYESGTEMGL